MEQNDIEMQQLDEASNLALLMKTKQKIKPFNFIEYLDKKNNRQQNKIKVSVCKDINGILLNRHYKHGIYLRNDSFIHVKQRNLSDLSTQNSSILSINEEKYYVKQIRQNNRKSFLVEIKQNEEYSLNGTGVIKLRDGRTIFGTWRAGLIVGAVKIIYPTGNTYVGDVINYIRHGYGEFSFSNGDKFSGSFVNGKIEGFGKMQYKQNSAIIQGIWQDGVFLQR